MKEAYEVADMEIFFFVFFVFETEDLNTTCGGCQIGCGDEGFGD